MFHLVLGSCPAIIEGHGNSVASQESDAFTAAKYNEDFLGDVPHRYGLDKIYPKRQVNRVHRHFSAVIIITTENWAQK
jgi:hypothetical protein